MGRSLERGGEGVSLVEACAQRRRAARGALRRRQRLGRRARSDRGVDLVVVRRALGRLGRWAARRLERGGEGVRLVEARTQRRGAA
eukprot:scaffold43888_cov57-Phaeocystis_antarctica.AAC.2